MLARDEVKRDLRVMAGVNRELASFIFEMAQYYLESLMQTIRVIKMEDPDPKIFTLYDGLKAINKELQPEKEANSVDVR